MIKTVLSLFGIHLNVSKELLRNKLFKFSLFMVNIEMGSEGEGRLREKPDP